MTELYIGDKHINAIFKDSKNIKKIYKGNKLLYHKFGGKYLTITGSNLYISYDLVNFKKIIENVEYLDSNDNIIMLRNGREIIYTYDLINFYRYTPPMTYQYSAYLKISNNNKFFMMDDWSTNKYLISDDGINWEKITSNISFTGFAGTNSSIYYYNGYYYTNSNKKLFKSNNLVNWEEVITLDMNNIYLLEFKGYLYVFCISFNATNNVENYYYRTNDGINWTTYRTPFAEEFEIRTNGDILFITTDYNYTSYGFNPGTYYSEDGINWIKSSEKTTGQFRLCYNGKKFIFHSPIDKKFYITEDGINFTEIINEAGCYPLVYLLDEYKTN